MKKPVRFLSALLLAISIMPGLLHPASFAALDEKTYGILSDILYAYKRRASKPMTTLPHR